MKASTKHVFLRAAVGGLVFGALSALTAAALRIESSELEARSANQQSDSTRLALWRMDSMLIPLLAKEAMRGVADLQRGRPETPLPSDESDLIRERFQVRPVNGGQQVPEALRHLGFEHLWGANEAYFLNSLPASGDDSAAGDIEPARQELSQRRAALIESQAKDTRRNVDGSDETPLTVFRPLWSRDKRLYLMRNVTIAGRRLVQGFLLDWSKCRERLLERIVDLLPAADLVAITPENAEAETNPLATIPVALVPGAIAASERRSWTPLRIVLVGGWCAVVAAFAAFGFALRAATELGERRGRFISAVTHELRTPLTTFRLYSQMLADGMVSEEKARQEYLETLRRESERLGAIVENVLLYARVEGKRGGMHRERLAAGELLLRIAPRLERRAADADMRLEVDGGDAAETVVEVDPQAVEQILYNLVDNSCKYGAQAADRRLHLRARRSGRKIEILYADHGPGIRPQDAGRIFLPFERGSAELAGGAYGIGLGLALARAMAEELGGSLALAPRAETGAAFLLRLPLAAGVTPRRGGAAPS
ncbi:MAG: HAMP domain-containing histidine kinase [Planctomycetes bacterium]|nr:HAMP domain-containing histidine kinase [Planctomycetota bacterium]